MIDWDRDCRGLMGFSPLWGYQVDGISFGWLLLDGCVLLCAVELGRGGSEQGRLAVRW